MTTIAEQAKRLLTDPRLHALVDAQTARGLEKYGHTLDDYDAPQEVRLAHLTQDLLDATQYALWCGERTIAALGARMLDHLMRAFPELDIEALLYREAGDV